jgi:hut operon positive regulator
MEISLDRIGKLALFAAMTSREEEELLKKEMGTNYPQFRLAVTFVTGTRSEVMKQVSRSAVSCALQNDVIQKKSGQVHAVVHATLEAIGGIVEYIPADTSLKLKLSIVSSHDWLSVAIYGDSAVHPATNHERAGLGIMHI